MITVFNKPALTRKQRFNRALIAGIAVTLLLTALLVILGRVFDFYMSILFVAAGFAIGYAIQYFGKGVQIHFSILAAALTLICIFVSDLFYFSSLEDILMFLTQFGIDSLWEIGYRVAAIYLAFRYSRIL